MKTTSLVILMFAMSTVESAPQSSPRSTQDATGTVHVDDLTLPASAYASAEAKADLIDRAKSARPPALSANVKALREFFGHYNDALAARMKELYSVKIEHKSIGGVRTEVITPVEVA